MEGRVTRREDRALCSCGVQPAVHTYRSLEVVVKGLGYGAIQARVAMTVSVSLLATISFSPPSHPLFNHRLHTILHRLVVESTGRKCRPRPSTK
jgi:hypothetical protein